MLSPHYCGCFDTVQRLGLVAYQLALPTFVKAHDVFHVYLLKKYVCFAKNAID